MSEIPGFLKFILIEVEKNNRTEKDLKLGMLRATIEYSWYIYVAYPFLDFLK